MLEFRHRGDFNNLEKFLKRMQKEEMHKHLAKLAQRGVEALRAATPVETGETANSWSYEITNNGSSWSISWINTHRHGTANVAILLQYGHGTGTGGYVQGTDYINPAMKPIFEQIANEVWKVVTSA